jgi:hypothetical protein
MIRLRGLLDLLARHGGGAIRACDLDATLAGDGREVRSALRAEGIVRDGPRAETVPCDGIGCAREVRELAQREGAPRRLFGVCTRDPAECELVEVAERDVAQEVLSRDAFVGALQRVLKVTPVPGATSDADANEVTVLGEERANGAKRDVLLAWRPGSPVSRAAVAERTTGGNAPRLLTLDALAEILTVRDGRLAEVPRLQLVTAAARVEAEPVLAAAQAPAEPKKLRRSPALDGMREITRWSEITLFDVSEDDLIGVTFDNRLRRLSCVDFGLASVRDRRPLDVFVLLQTICQGNGLFVTRAFGSKENGKRLMSELRVAMRATFGLEGDPFERYSFKEHSWKPKFRALAAAPVQVDEVTRALRGDGS